MDVKPGRPCKNSDTHVRISDVHPKTATRYRHIARHWDDVLWPLILAGKTKAMVTQAAMLRAIRLFP